MAHDPTSQGAKMDLIQEDEEDEEKPVPQELFACSSAMRSRYSHCHIGAGILVGSPGTKAETQLQIASLSMTISTMLLSCAWDKSGKKKGSGSNKVQKDSVNRCFGFHLSNDAVLSGASHLSTHSLDQITSYELEAVLPFMETRKHHANQAPCQRRLHGPHQVLYAPTYILPPSKSKPQ